MLLDVSSDRRHAHISDIVREILHRSTLAPADLMVVGAACRDVLHAQSGAGYDLVATHDVDIAIAVNGWRPYDALIETLDPIGNTGVRFLIHNLKVDIMPFGRVEEPVGVVEPKPRNEPMSVWAFTEVYESSNQLRLQKGVEVQIPTSVGYAALKLGAWVDRVAYGEVKDARDLATAMSWFVNKDDVEDRIYTTAEGEIALTDSDWSIPAAAVQLLGSDVRGLVGPARIVELGEKWNDAQDVRLVEQIVTSRDTGLPGRRSRADELVSALKRGLFRS